jgi:unsaturated rhamnogalacturonyl hydrolase
MKKTTTFIFGVLLLALSSCSQKQPGKELNWAEEMAQSDMQRNPEAWMIDFRKDRDHKWEYTHGLMMSAHLELYHATGNPSYLEYAQGFANDFISENGDILTYKAKDFNIDRVNPGKFLIELHQITGEARLKLAIEKLRTQMRHHPRTSEGGFWHKKVYPDQMWLDGLYMGAPFLAQYAHVYNEPELFADVALQYKLVDKNMYDPETGLYYHAWDESRQQQWADSITGHSSGFWGRSLGWYAMGLVDATSWFPENHPDRQILIDLINKLADNIIKYQTPETGLWWQVPDQPGREGNYEEATGSTMLTYFLIKSVRLGYIGDHYLNYGTKGYEGIINNLIREDPDGSINLEACCAVAGLGGTPYRDGTYEYYISEPIRDNDPKGVGPFIMASVELDKLKNR